MLAKRIIPCLDVNNGRVVKGVNFVNIRDAGDPVELATYYSKQGADEIVLSVFVSMDPRHADICKFRPAISFLFLSMAPLASSTLFSSRSVFASAALPMPNIPGAPAVDAVSTAEGAAAEGETEEHGEDEEKGEDEGQTPEGQNPDGKGSDGKIPDGPSKSGMFGAWAASALLVALIAGFWFRGGEGAGPKTEELAFKPQFTDLLERGFVREVEKYGARAWVWSDYIRRHPLDEFCKRMPKTVVQNPWTYRATKAKMATVMKMMPASPKA